MIPRLTSYTTALSQAVSRMGKALPQAQPRLLAPSAGADSFVRFGSTPNEDPRTAHLLKAKVYMAGTLYEGGIFEYNKALELSDMDDPEQLIPIYTGLAEAHEKIGEADKAAEYQERIQLLQKRAKPDAHVMGHPPAEDCEPLKLEFPSWTAAMAATKRALDDKKPDKAMECLRFAKSHWLEKKDHDKNIELRTLMSRTFQQKGDYPKAEAQLLEVKKHMDALGLDKDDMEWIKFHNQMGWLLTKFDDRNDEAQESFLKTLDVLENNGYEEIKLRIASLTITNIYTKYGIPATYSALP